MKITEIRIENNKKSEGLVALFKRLKKEINFSLGIEIEGEFKYDPEISRLVYSVLKEDGSIREFNEGEGWEIVSKKITTPSQVEKFLLDVRYLYNELEIYGYPENKSTGLHIHLGGGLLMYIANYEFAHYIVNSFISDSNEELANSIREKIDGNYLEEITNYTNSWANKEMNIMDSYRDSSRYKAVNFHSLWKHGTVELRFFFTPKEYKDFIYILKQLFRYLYSFIKEKEKNETEEIFDANIYLINKTKKIIDEENDEIEIGNIEGEIEIEIEKNIFEVAKSFWSGDVFNIIDFKIDKNMINKKIKTNGNFRNLILENPSTNNRWDEYRF